MHGYVIRLSQPDFRRAAGGNFFAARHAARLLAETVLHSFAGGSDGAEPFAGLIADNAGNLYGTTRNGVFKLSPGGTETVLHSFTGSDGAVPLAGLIADSAGNLYGTTAVGGASGNGTVFKLAGTGFAVLAGTPGTPNCEGKSVSALAKQYGGLPAAATALSYPTLGALEDAIKTYCRS
jgi:uncharacterized repeat protein (TIGR03803 family)